MSNKLKRRNSSAGSGWCPLRRNMQPSARCLHCLPPRALPGCRGPPHGHPLALAVLLRLQPPQLLLLLVLVPLGAVLRAQLLDLLIRLLADLPEGGGSGAEGEQAALLSAPAAWQRTEGRCRARLRIGPANRACISGRQEVRGFALALPTAYSHLSAWVCPVPMLLYCCQPSGCPR